MILLLGSDAYSPFRLDALRAAIAKLDPSLGPVDIDAKWVYALQTAGESFDIDELKRAESLLCAEGDRFFNGLCLNFYLIFHLVFPFD